MYRTENAVHACKKILKELYVLHVNSEVCPNACKIEKHIIRNYNHGLNYLLNACIMP